MTDFESRDDEARGLIKLSDATLGDIPAQVKRPTYDRSELTPGIVHIGLGNFHRAHQAWYLHRLFQIGLNQDWAIIGAGVRPYDEQMRQKMQAQDYLTTLIELDPAGKSAEVIGSMIGYVPVEEGNGALIQQMADRAIRIVALTVTEGGYYIDPATKGFDDKHPDIQHDAGNPGHPRTAFGAIVAALKIRRDRNTDPFTGLSCDNLQGNGNILHQTVVSLARLSDPDLAEWIDTNCSFPNSMVDCIVPATGPRELALAREFSLDDPVPVTHEPFRQWVMEDRFCAGRPDLDKVGAQFTDDVHDFEKMKIRILNGSHQVVSDVGEILGIETIAETMANPGIHALYRKVAEEEISPHVRPVPGFTPLEYVDLIDQRFSNPEIVDTTRRVAFDGSSRHAGFVIPSIRDGLKANTPVQGLALVEAAWARYCLGIREDGIVIEDNDPFWDVLTAKAKEAKDCPRAWLEMRHNYGDLADDPRFADAFEHWLNKIHSEGMEAALDEYLNS
jgi:mannitol 2-dehydrogenase